MQNIKTIKIDHELSGIRIDLFIHSYYSDISRTMIQKCIGKGLISVNSSPVKKKRKLLREGDIVEIDEKSIRGIVDKELIQENNDLDILFEDEYLIAVNKPAGMVVHPGSGNKKGTMANSLLANTDSLSEGYSKERPGIVHRLDKDTSGVIIVAKTNKAHYALGELFSQRKIIKKYTGICTGKKPPPSGKIEIPIGRSKTNPVKQVARDDGKYALTSFRLIRHIKSISFVEFQLHTGRTHQIRVHAGCSGFPVLADKLYGEGGTIVKRRDPSDRHFVSSVLKCFSRQALHAREISFEHPFTHEMMSIKAPFPEDFVNALNVFGGEEGKT